MYSKYFITSESTCTLSMIKFSRDVAQLEVCKDKRDHKLINAETSGVLK